MGSWTSPLAPMGTLLLTPVSVESTDFLLTMRQGTLAGNSRGRATPGSGSHRRVSEHTD